MEQLTVGLVVVDENGRRSEPHTLGPATLIGFDPSVDVRIEDPSVGDRHLLLTQGGDAFELVDMGAGGTKLNGNALAPGDRLRVGAGDTIEIGSTILELVRLERGPDPHLPAAPVKPEVHLAPEYGVDWGDDRRRSPNREERNWSWLAPVLIGFGMLYGLLTYGLPAAMNAVTKPLDLFPESPKQPTATVVPRKTIPEDQKTYDPMYVPPVPTEEPLPVDEPEEPEAPPPAAPGWWKPLLGRLGTAKEAAEFERRSGEGRVAWLLTVRDLYANWLRDQRRVLGLTGTHQPRRDTRDLVEGLRKRTVAPLQALRALASDPAFKRRHLGAAAFAEAVISRILGADPGKLNATRQAIIDVYEGRPTEVFGKLAQSPEQVLAFALDDPRAREALVQRAWTLVRGAKAAPAGVLERAASQVERRPHDLFRLLVEWARDA